MSYIAQTQKKHLYYIDQHNYKRHKKQINEGRHKPHKDDENRSKHMHATILEKKNKVIMQIGEKNEVMITADGPVWNLLLEQFFFFWLEQIKQTQTRETYW
ncbi:unnamed protein product [Eruca vesicaria subsp. sativa]|uniref:Uncharacterized protein n=1 Tax=Eruca vesicaria subsp. sativa TaxID=29727 RepID=A0ABC8KC32_ERUVS|nr:unnamed protein product [Eruca vesicaria subsp. sativa]